jgi:vacuolar-type H+-ATPase subunit F/Vma7
MNILKEKFCVDLTEASDSLNAKRKCDTIILNDEPMQKKNKETDLFDNQSDNECFVDIESEEDEEIF